MTDTVALNTKKGETMTTFKIDDVPEYAGSSSGLRWLEEQPYSQIPRMTHVKELQWVRDWISRSYTGQGRILEFGCWLGAVTATILDALTQFRAIYPDEFVIPHVFDEFIWRPYMVRRSDAIDAGFRIGVKSVTTSHFQPGDNFFAEWLRNIGYENRTKVEVTCGRFEGRDTVYPHPIELAYLDALKSKPAVHGFVTWYLPQVIEGGTIVDQDYYYRIKNDCMPFLGKFWDYMFEQEYVVPVSKCVSSLVMMRTDKPLSEDAVELSEEVGEVMKGVE